MKKLEVNDNIKTMEQLENNSRLHRMMRVGLWRAKKRYGDDYAREQAAEIWKLTSAEKERFINEEYAKTYTVTDGSIAVSEETVYRLSEEFVEKLTDLFKGWEDKFTDAENEFIRVKVLAIAVALTSDLTDELEQRQDCLQFLDDITVVRLRIRKLTPRECGRLMGCDEKTIDVMENCGVSNSSLYKLYGNSIVVNVLFHIFRKMFIDTKPDYEYYKQLSIF